MDEGSAMDELTAIVLNWRTAELALRARAALIADGVAPERVLLVDNGSDDDSVARLSAGAPDAPLLILAENLGFARANNLAARRLPATRCYLFVNSDAFAHAPGSVAALAGAVAQPGVAIAVPRLRNADLTLQPSVRPLAGPLPALVQAAGLSRLVPDRWQPALGTHWSHDRSRTIRAADGAVLAVDAARFARVGGFSERTHLYGEDHDLFRRLARDGGTARFVAEAEFIHLAGAASRQRWSEAERAEQVAVAEGSILLSTLPRLGGRLTVASMAAGAGLRARWMSRRGRPEQSAVQMAWRTGYRTALARDAAPRAASRTGG